MARRDLAYLAVTMLLAALVGYGVGDVWVVIVAFVAWMMGWRSHER